MDYIDVAQNFSIIRRRTQAFVVEACNDMHLTYSEFVLLLRLYDNEGCSQDEMGKILYWDKAVITRVIKILEEKKLIFRKIGKRDRRVKLMYLTGLGWELEERVKGIVKKLLSFLTEDMGEEKVKILMAGFAEIAEKLGKADFKEVCNTEGGTAVEQ